jgi:hypothetical protein
VRPKERTASSAPLAQQRKKQLTKKRRVGVSIRRRRVRVLSDVNEKSVLAVLAALSWSGFLAAVDTRTVPFDLFLIIDGSSLPASAKEAADAWMCKHLLDDLLRDGDHLTIWTASGKRRGGVYVFPQAMLILPDFSGWRVLAIGLGLSSQARRAASNYIRGTP